MKNLGSVKSRDQLRESIWVERNCCSRDQREDTRDKGFDIFEMFL